jgi:hypothetical protein
LVNELNAYRSPEKDYFSIFVDCLNPVATAQFGLSKSAHIAAVVFHPDRLQKVLPSDTPVELRALVQRSVKSGKPLGITLGCALVRAELDGVLDLRLADTQDWFLRAFLPSGPLPTNATSFRDILPELLNQNYGGSTGSNMRLQAIGAQLRKAGVKGLIFPSARSDVSVTYKNGQLVDSHGWNMVAYRGRAPREVIHHDLGGWETAFDHGIKCVAKRNWLGRTQGWSVQGLELHNMLKYDFLMKQKGYI